MFYKRSNTSKVNKQQLYITDKAPKQDCSYPLTEFHLICKCLLNSVVYIRSHFYWRHARCRVAHRWHHEVGGAVHRPCADQRQTSDLYRANDTRWDCSQLSTKRDAHLFSDCNINIFKSVSLLIHLCPTDLNHWL